MSVLDAFAVPGRFAVVTGGNRGLGRACSHALGEAGARVAGAPPDEVARRRVGAHYGVRVNAVAPGYVRTGMTPIDRPEFAVRWIGDAPQQRAAVPEEIAPAVFLLASPASAFMTGPSL